MRCSPAGAVACSRAQPAAMGEDSEGSLTGDNSLDDAIFALYKKKKVKILKRKFNISSINELDQFKKNKCLFFGGVVAEQSYNASQISPCVKSFQSNIENAYGHVISFEVIAAVLQCFKDFCIGATSEQSCSYKDFAPRILKLLYFDKEQNVDSLYTQTNINIPVQGVILSFKPHNAPVTCDLKLSLRTDPHGEILKQKGHCVSPIPAERKSFDLNEPLVLKQMSSKLKPAAKMSQKFSSTSHRHIGIL